MAQPNDIGALRDVFRRSSLSNEGNRASLLANPDVLVFPIAPVLEHRTRVAVCDGQVIGFVTTSTAGDVVELDDLFVDPEWMRRGVASELIHDVVTVAREQGSARVEVTANPHALGFYQAAGFVVHGAAETRFGPASRMHLDLAS